MTELDELNEQDVYLAPRRRPSWVRWAIVAAVGLLILCLAGVAAAVGARHLIGAEPTAIPPRATLVPTYTPRPTSTPAPDVVTLSTRPWTDDRGPVGMVEVNLTLPRDARAGHEPPPGFRYWTGDLVHTRHGLAWTGAGGDGSTELRWYLFREPGTTLPTTLEVTVDGHPLSVTLEPGTPATASTPLE